MMPLNRPISPAALCPRRSLLPWAGVLLCFLTLTLASSHPARADNARRQLVVQNHTAEPVRVFVAYHSITSSGQWGWFNTDDRSSWVLKPGERSALNDRGFIVNADIVRVRARGERSARSWDWGESFIGESARGPSKVIGQTLVTVWAEDGLPLFSDRHTRRQLAIKNSTGVTLYVCIAYHARSPDGTWGWQNTDCGRHWVYAPGELSFAAFGPKRIEANAVKLYARSETGDRAWTEHRDDALFIGDWEPSEAVVGSYTYTFSDEKGRPFAPLKLRSVSVKPSSTSVGQPVTVTIEYTLESFFAGRELDVFEEQRIEHGGKVLGRFSNAARRGPGTYRSTRSITIPILAEAGEYAVVGTVGLGRRLKSYLGVQVRDLTPEDAASRALDGARGALVVKVDAESPAAKGGLRAGDLIVRFGERKLEAAQDLVRSAGESPSGRAESPSGRAVTLTVVRDGLEEKLSVTPGKPPKSMQPKTLSKRVALRVTAP